ncbi:hypothetical protein ACW9IF_01245 [Pseudomonas tolaasii]
MIAYHDTPVAGTRQDGARFLAGRHALMPFPRQDDMGIVADVCQSFVFDNGAFSVWKKGGKLDVDGYTARVEQWHRHPGLDWPLIPDVIDGDESANDPLLEACPRKLRGVPVRHLHESLDRLQRLAVDWPPEAIGSTGQWAHPGTAVWWKRMGSAMDPICDDQGRSACRLLGLRMLEPATFQNLPFASADSTNAAVNGGSISRSVCTYHLLRDNGLVSSQTESKHTTVHRFGAGRIRRPSS